MLVSRPRSRLDTAVSYLSNLFWTEVANCEVMQIARVDIKDANSREYIYIRAGVLHDDGSISIS